MKRFFQFLFTVVGILVVIGIVMTGAGLIALFRPPEAHVAKASIMSLDLDGIIMDGKDFLDLLRKHRKDDKIKGILIRVSSPGGVVGPSQEIFDEIKRTREEFKKPVVAYCSSVMASGAYYASVAADKIYTTPGCMMGSIGALIQFVNLEKLYDWARIQRYAITTGRFKDAGAEYKAMSPEARQLFQEMLNDVLSQFKGAILAGRKMKEDHLNQYADGRVFTGAQAVQLGFADQVGSWEDARQALGEMTGLGRDPEVFKARKPRGFREFLEEASGESKLSRLLERVTPTSLNAQPLFLLPGAGPF